MTHLLLEWLQPFHITKNINDDFRTGYQFGVLLTNLGFKSSQPYISSSTNAAILHNYIIIEVVLRERLNLVINAGQTVDLVEGVNGCWASLLSRVKDVHDRVVHQVVVEVDDEISLESYPSSELSELYIREPIREGRKEVGESHYGIVLRQRLKREVARIPAQHPRKLAPIPRIIKAVDESIKRRLIGRVELPKGELLEKEQIKKDKYLVQLRAQKIEMASVMQALEKRRKMELVHQQNILTDLVEKAANDVLLRKLMRESKAEREIARKLELVMDEKARIKMNRIVRERQYEEMRARERAEKVIFEQVETANSEREYREVVGVSLKLHRELLSKVEDERLQGITDWLRGLVVEIIELVTSLTALNMSLGQVTSLALKDNSKETRVLYRNLRLLFRSGVGLSDDNLHQLELQDYIQCKGEWETKIEVKPGLSDLIDKLFQSTVDPPQLTVYPVLPLRVMILGKPYAGKHSLANKLSLKYNLTVLNVEDIVLESSLDDGAVVNLVIKAINEVVGGFVLVGFPKTRNQALLMESGLTGYEEEKLGRKEMKRGNGKGRSQIVEAEKQLSEDIIRCAFNLVIVVEVEDETVFERFVRADVYKLTPPAVGLKERNDDKQLEYLVHSYSEEIEGIREFYRPFKVLRCCSFDQVEDILIETVNTLNASEVIVEVQVIEEGKKDKEKERILVDQWITLETSYINSLIYYFKSVKDINANSLFYFKATKDHFLKYLDRPHSDLLSSYQQDYNKLESDFKLDPDVKAELHWRVEELREKLFDIVDKRRDEADAERLSVIEDRWLEDMSYTLTNLFISILQAEVDRFLNTRLFLIDYYTLNQSTYVTTQTSPLKLPFVPLTNQPPIEIATALLQASESLLNKRKEVPIQPKKVQSKGKAAVKLQPVEPIVYDPESIAFGEITGVAEYTLQTLTDFQTEGDALLENELAQLKQRINRLTTHTLLQFKYYRNKAVSFFVSLDDLSGQVFKNEVSAVRSLAILLKEAIEADQTLPNKLSLNSSLILDYATLLHPLPPPISTRLVIEKPDLFTLSQLTTITSKLSPYIGGAMTARTLIDWITKALIYTPTYFPDTYYSMDITAIVVALDPYGTGTIDWRKFWLFNAKILPIDLEKVTELVEDFGKMMREHSQIVDGMMDRSIFDKSPFWFEKDFIEYNPVDFKAAIFDVFKCVINGCEMFDSLSFVLSCCCDTEIEPATEKVFRVFEGGGLVTKDATEFVLLYGRSDMKNSNRFESSAMDQHHDYSDCEKGIEIGRFQDIVRSRGEVWRLVDLNIANNLPRPSTAASKA